MCARIRVLIECFGFFPISSSAFCILLPDKCYYKLYVCIQEILSFKLSSIASYGSVLSFGNYIYREVIKYSL